MSTKPVGIRVFRAIHESLDETVRAMPHCPEIPRLELEGLAGAATAAALRVLVEARRGKQL